MHEKFKGLLPTVTLFKMLKYKIHKIKLCKIYAILKSVHKDFYWITFCLS